MVYIYANAVQYRTCVCAHLLKGLPMVYIVVRLAENRYRWIRPSPGRLEPSPRKRKHRPYVSMNGFGHEDWNFNTRLLIRGHVYGYCYYQPREAQRTNRFTIAFTIYFESQWYLVGLYRDCEYVPAPPVSQRVITQKMHDLRQLGDSLAGRLRRLGDRELRERLEKDAQWAAWKVLPKNVVCTMQPIAIPESVFASKSYRMGPREINKGTLDALYALATRHVYEEDSGRETVFPEGREVERQHNERERHPAVIRLAKERFKYKHGRLFCQICAFDFCKEYGSIGYDYIEAHHTAPLADSRGAQKTRIADIAMVCANCHRMLHRRRPWLTMDQLRRLITAHKKG